jgi:hypothetical protein
LKTLNAPELKEPVVKNGELDLIELITSSPSTSSENDEYFVMVNNDSKYESGKTNGSSDRVDNDKNQYFH